MRLKNKKSWNEVKGKKKEGGKLGIRREEIDNR